MKIKKIFTRDNLEISTLIGIFLISVLALTPNVNADEIKHKFKNPSFSGIGTASHYLTVENQEFSRKKEIEDALAAAKKAAAGHWAIAPSPNSTLGLLGTFCAV